MDGGGEEKETAVVVVDVAAEEEEEVEEADFVILVGTELQGRFTSAISAASCGTSLKVKSKVVMVSGSVP